MKTHRLHATQRGVALIEFALILPLLLILTFIVTEFGRALMTYDTLTRSVRDAARYLSMQVPGTGLTEARNLVVFGKTTAGGPPIVPGLSLANVPDPTWQATGSTPEILTVSIQVSGYGFTPLVTSAFGLSFGPLPFNNIVATMRSQP